MLEYGENGFEVDIFEVNKFEKKIIPVKYKIERFCHVNKNSLLDYDFKKFYSNFKDNFNSQIERYLVNSENNKPFKLFYSKGIVDKLKFEF